MSVSRYLLILAAVGIFIRVVWIGLPLLEDYNWLRQTQTADGSKSLMERGFWPPYGVASWRGDLEAKLVLELPVYSYLAAGLGMVTGDLDMGGRLVSLGLWVVSYFLAMAIFRRILSEAELRWAALLYVIAPLSIELGIAFQPEMLVQVCGLGFLLTALCYLDRPTGARLVGLFLIGGIGVCVKLPTMSHYYLIFGILLWGREGWRAALRVRYWLFAIGTLLSLKLWGGYVDSVNAAAFPEWTASNILKAFTTQFSALVSVHSWVKVGAYFGAFLVTIVGVPFVVAGFVRVLRSRDWGGMPFLWCLGTLVFYVIWGPRTAMGHAYYNLPALAPLAMLFGM
ncbi:MAG: glycosyltransferase family 39 protein [Verrucomicrobiota bacterium]